MKEREEVSRIEIIFVDDKRAVHAQVASKSSVAKLHELMEKFTIDIHVNCFQPTEFICLSPCWCWDLLGEVPFTELDSPIAGQKWEKWIPSLGDGVKEQIVYNALKDYLETFSQPLEKALSGPFVVDMRSNL